MNRLKYLKSPTQRCFFPYEWDESTVVRVYVFVVLGLQNGFDTDNDGTTGMWWG
jgi:hypothetical protein